MPTLYSYVVATDSGAAPNPFGGVCTLVICKPQIRRTAKIGDWIVGTGSARSPVGDIQGHVVYAMRVSAKMRMAEYEDLAQRSLPIKIPGGDSPSPLSRFGDAIYDFSETPPRLRRSSVHCEENRSRDLGGEYALLSEHFYYFGSRSKPFPERLRPIIKEGPGHRSRANDDHVEAFIEWIEGLSEKPNQIHGKPAELKDYGGFEEALAKVESSSPSEITSEDISSQSSEDSETEKNPNRSSPSSSRISSANVTSEELSQLRSRSAHPNAKTAAYICGMLLHDGGDAPSHDALVTSSNLAVLLAWDRGIDLSDLDAVRFNVLQSRSGPVQMEIRRGDDSISVPVIDRPFSLEEPWSGFYQVSKVVQGTREEEPAQEGEPVREGEHISSETNSTEVSPAEQAPPMEAAWQNWKNGESFCQGCPGRDSLYPLGGLGSPESDLMLVAKEPNYNVEENTVEKNMSWPDAKQAMERDRRVSNKNNLWPQMRTVAEAAGLSGPTDLYFTNVAKCNDKDSSEDTWDQRRTHCRGYLAREIETVSPNALLLYGRYATGATFRALGLRPPSKITDVHAQPREVGDRTLVPLVHWAHAMYEGRIDEYTEEVAEVVGRLF